MGFHIVKRDNCPLWKKCCLYLGAVVLALLLGAVLLISLGVDPIAYKVKDSLIFDMSEDVDIHRFALRKVYDSTEIQRA